MTTIKCRKFKSVADGVTAMIASNWKLLAGSTSNRSTHYDVEGVGETVDGQIIAILKSAFNGRLFVSPSEMVLTKEGPLAMGNYGTPESSSTLDGAIASFNNTYSQENCRWDICRIRPFSKITWKDGTDWTAS